MHSKFALVAVGLVMICPGPSAGADSQSATAMLVGTTDPPSQTKREQAAMNEAVDFDEQIQPLLDERCVMCHMTGAENGNLALETGRSITSLVNAPSSESPLLSVAPGNPSESYLMHKLKGTHVQAGGLGDRMPLASSPLSAEEIASIEAWIRSLPQKK